MKLLSFLKSPTFRSVGSPCQNVAPTAVKRSAFVSGFVPAGRMPELRSKTAGMLSGPSPSGLGHTADDDARGIKAEYLRSEACKSLFIGQTFMVLAANATFFVIWLALGQSYLAAISLAVPSSVFWRNAWNESRRSARLYIASNLQQHA